MSNLKSYPKISIVTPSFNQGQYLEQTILSVINQKYPNLEYIIIDGGSTDNSVEIIKKYENYLTYWVSEPDKGQYDAINKGFSKTSGEILAWLNSDDMYVPWTFQTVAEIFNKFEFINWISGIHGFWNINGTMINVTKYYVYVRDFIKNGFYSPSVRSIQQESTFWRRDIWVKSGGKLNTSYNYAADFELWKRFAEHDYLFTVNAILGGFRHQPEQKTSQINKYLEEIKDISKNGLKIRLLTQIYNLFHTLKISYMRRMDAKADNHYTLKKNIPYVEHSLKTYDWVCYFDNKYK